MKPYDFHLPKIISWTLMFFCLIAPTMAQEFEDERSEIQSRLRQLEKEQEFLSRQLKSIENTAQFHRKLKTIERRLAAAEKAGDPQLIEELQRSAGVMELRIDALQQQRDASHHQFELQQLISELRAEDEPELIHPIEDFSKAITEMSRLRSLEIELEIRNEPPPESVDDDFDELERRLEIGERHVDLIYELREAYEVEDEDAIDELLEEIQDNLNHDEAARKQTKDKSSLQPIRPDMLPVTITPERLAIVANQDFQRDVVPRLETFCIDCHDSTTASGDLDIESLIGLSPIVRGREQWINVIEQIKNRAMPPADGTELPEADRIMLVNSLHNKIYDFDYETVRHPGSEPARRLTHEEYDNTIRDLFGVDLRPTSNFPEDFVGSSGFENSANTLFIQPLLMERYIGTAERVVETLLPEEPKTESHFRTRNTVLSIRSNEEEFQFDRSISGFLSRAFRRPVTNSELKRAQKQYDSAINRGLSEFNAAKLIVQTALVSPKFLLKTERARVEGEAKRIDDFDLANRLSYFLWATMPDDELFELAKLKKLHKPAILSTQIDRMIADPRSETLGSVFAAQWLGASHLGKRVRLDPIDNPWCTESLMKAMRDETAMFFHSLIQDNRPLTELVDSDYTYLNEELANLYGIPDVRGQAMRRVELETNQRGGIFAHGSLLAVTSFPGRTSPVVRGHWILDTVLGTPPPPPPPNVSELDERIERNERLSFREKLERHREMPNCYACHSQMDPLGFSLEGYDWFGRFRNRRGRYDTRGQLPSGTEFEGLSGLKHVIATEKMDELSRQTVNKTLSYALGRQIEYYDELAIRSIVKQFAADDYSMRTLIHAVVGSYPFNFKQAVKSN